MKTDMVKLGKIIKPESMTLNERINLRGVIAATTINNNLLIDNPDDITILNVLTNKEEVK